MTSASIFEDTSRNDTEVFFVFQFSNFKFDYDLSTSLYITNYLTKSIQFLTARRSKILPPDENLVLLPRTSSDTSSIQSIDLSS